MMTLLSERQVSWDILGVYLLFMKGISHRMTDEEASSLKTSKGDQETSTKYQAPPPLPFLHWLLSINRIILEEPATVGLNSKHAPESDAIDEMKVKESVTILLFGNDASQSEPISPQPICQKGGLAFPMTSAGNWK
ncbi:PREDICTED: uncharacterized protein LOC104812947 [Tarenaya hassleriana]|uniref:uncharacterized protein LOC104812947 n=1 Tax=Tarenaya hassleriana TaxID=28532 RepID=UPI00053C1767|nr:PREDICTED: uncharacterized protein LOC104812947 [Tarenaya hassleriana]XP_010538681.1 PREDICTED: uncharacterized protein LOC104812947 [Tarenaya hassleriana]